MQRCGVFTFRIEAEESKKEITLAGQCRFKTAEAKLAEEGGEPNRNSYVKNVEEPPELMGSDAEDGAEQPWEQSISSRASPPQEQPQTWNNPNPPRRVIYLY